MRGGALEAFGACSNPGADDKVRIAFLYQEQLAGSYQKGFQDALGTLEPSRRQRISDCEEFYTTDQDGVPKLVSLIQRNKADIVVGPTFSGVYLGAIERLQQFEINDAKKVPVISPLVQAATVPNRPDGWFFRTNVDTPRRVEVMMNFITNYGIRSITVLHPNTGFGRQAEEQFRQKLQRKISPHYQSIEYKIDGSNRSDVVANVLDRRPAALGIFGPPLEIINLMKAIKQSATYPYRPWSFTISDAGRYAGFAELDGLHFLSVSKAVEALATRSSDQQQPEKASQKGTSPQEGSCGTTDPALCDEIEALAYDTTRLVLDRLEAMPNGPFDAVRFRDSFASALQNRPERGEKSGMYFYSLQNEADPGVYVIEAEKIGHAPQAAEMSSWAFLLARADLVTRRFGSRPWFNVLMMIGVAVLLTGFDLKKSFEGRFANLFTYRYFWLLCIVNVGLIIAIYLYLGEEGMIQYDSWQAALAVSMGPSVLLRTTLFETPTGKAIGLAKLYDRFLNWINEKMMLRRHTAFQRFVDIIAFYNPRKSLQDKLHEVYQNARTRELRENLERDLTDAIEQELTFLEKRRVCARRLLSRFQWADLREEFAPASFRMDDPPDPSVLIRTAARCCQTDPEKGAKLDTITAERIEARGKWAEKLSDDLNEAIAREGAASEEFIKAQFLVTRCSFDLETLVDEGLLDPDELPADFPRPSVSAKPQASRRAERGADSEEARRATTKTAGAA